MGPITDAESRVTYIAEIRTERRPRDCITQTTWVFEMITDDGASIKAIVSMPLRDFRLPELELLFELEGWEIEHLYGDYDRRPFSDDSPMIIPVLRRS